MFLLYLHLYSTSQRNGTFQHLWSTSKRWQTLIASAKLVPICLALANALSGPLFGDAR